MPPPRPFSFPHVPITSTIEKDSLTQSWQSHRHADTVEGFSVQGRPAVPRGPSANAMPGLGLEQLC